MLHRSLFGFCAFWLCQAAVAQCGVTINSFPYSEGFEADAAWVSGGTNDDWEWGTPAHPIINGPGGGTKSWCVGSLNGQGYPASAQSWLMSPCFDFSALPRPWISFKIFWECERQYDGMVLQYSLDGGDNWDNVGAYGDPEDCLNANWYNSSNISNLTQASPKHGWSGREGPTQGNCQGGSGSEGWVTASHCMGDLAGEPSVRFRFLFGSGTTCNDYDGVALDDIFIDNSPLPPVSFTHACVGNAVSFTAEEGDCPTVFNWNFGDPASGAQNTASGTNVSHDFSAAGTYTVVLSATSPCSPVVTYSEEVVVIGVELTAVAATCGASNGSLEAVVTGGGGPFTYDWQPGGGNTAVMNGLAPGSYTVTVSGTGVCAVSVEGVVADQPSPLVVTLQHTDVSCGGLSDGTATADVTGGNATSYSWSPSGGSNAVAAGLAGGAYTVTVTDANGCQSDATVTIAEAPVLTVSIAPEVDICSGASVVLSPTGAGGVGPYSYTWSPEGPEVAPTETTSYDVVATDAAGCVSAAATVTVNVGAAVQPTLSVVEPSGCAPHCVTLVPGPPGLTYAFVYGDGNAGAAASHCYDNGGLYDVQLTVTDANGCSGAALFEGLVEAYPQPQAGFSVPSTVLVSSGPVQVVQASSGATSWAWNLGGASGDDTVPAPVLQFPSVGCYPLELTVTNDQGCSDRATAEICVENEFTLFAPNCFTPNGDGMNEVFAPVISVRAPAFYELLIFDRWGQVVFTSSEPTDGWNGENAMDGVYAWRLTLRDSESKLRKEAGHVLLLR
jgi:gliding motility-associated-like protein